MQSVFLCLALELTQVLLGRCELRRLVKGDDLDILDDPFRADHVKDGSVFGTDHAGDEDGIGDNFAIFCNLESTKYLFAFFHLSLLVDRLSLFDGKKHVFLFYFDIFSVDGMQRVERRNKKFGVEGC